MVHRSGHPSLTHDAPADMPDFSRPGSDGALPDGFAEWQRGVTYTVRPELLAPLASGRDYRLNVTLRRRHPLDREFTGYDELYQRVSGIAAARVAAVAERKGPGFRALRAPR